MDSAAKLERLLQEARLIEGLGGTIQGPETSTLSTDEVRDIRDRYQTWYAAALPLLPEDLKSRFQKEYEGGAIVSKIRAFFTEPTRPSPLTASMPDDKRKESPFSPWRHPHGTAFHGPFLEQQSILRQARARCDHASAEPKIQSVAGGLRHSIALACKDHYVINAIDGLFISHGCRETWWTTPTREFSSSRMKQVYGWFEGIALHDPSSEAEIAKGVGEMILADLSVGKDRREAIASALGRQDGMTRDGHPLDRYNLHPRVRAVAGQLFQDGHYRQAVLDSYIALTDAVKARSGRPDLDTSKLMLHVFSKDKTILRCSQDADEQMGFMWLFAGAVMAIRNPRAHHLEGENRLSVDEVLEWLAFASALFRVLDATEKV